MCDLFFLPRRIHFVTRLVPFVVAFRGVAAAAGRGERPINLRAATADTTVVINHRSDDGAAVAACFPFASIKDARTYISEFTKRRPKFARDVLRVRRSRKISRDTYIYIERERVRGNFGNTLYKLELRSWPREKRRSSALGKSTFRLQELENFSASLLQTSRFHDRDSTNLIINLARNAEIFPGPNVASAIATCFRKRNRKSRTRGGRKQRQKPSRRSIHSLLPSGTTSGRALDTLRARFVHVLYILPFSIVRGNLLGEIRWSERSNFRPQPRETLLWLRKCIFRRFLSIQ